MMATGESKTKWKGDLPNKKDKGEIDKLILSYPGRKSSEMILGTSPAELMQLCNNSDVNQLYYGDNLGILSHFCQSDEYLGQIKLIYIDPPFGTNSVFKSRSRKDAYQDLLTGSQYIEFIRERLILMYELLADDGSIYVHLDSNMVFHIKIVLDEIFGVNGFRNLITRRKSNPKNYTRNQYGNVADYILFYTKSDNYIWNRAYVPWTKEKISNEYAYIEKETGRRFKKVPIHAPGERNGDTGKPWKGLNPPPGKHWQYRRETLDKLDANGEIYWSSNGNPRRKVYLDQSQGIPVQDIWLDVKDAHNQNIRITGYPTEKPRELLERIIKASSNEGDLVLDCFCGSGTTLEISHRLKRRWIGIDKSDEAITTVLDRFANGINPMGDYVENNDKPEKPKQVKLPLFSQDKAIQSEHVSITDFSILTSQPYDDKLKDTIEQWKSFLKQIDST